MKNKATTPERGSLLPPAPSVGSTGWGGEREWGRVTGAERWLWFRLCPAGAVLAGVGMGDVWEEGIVILGGAVSQKGTLGGCCH